VQAAADDDAPEGKRAELVDVLDVPHAAAGDDRNLPGLGEKTRVNQIRALEHAVLADVGVEDGGERPVGDLPGDVDGGLARSVRPGAGGDDAVFRVERE